MITVNRQLTARTIEDTLLKRHLLPMSTPAARLAGIGRVDFDELPASFCRFAGQLSKERRPRRVMNALGQTMVLDHAVDMQVLNRYHPVGSDDLAAVLMGEVVPSPRDTLMDTRHGFAMCTPLRRTFCQCGVFPLHLCQGLFFRAKEPGISNFSAIGKSGKGLESYVNPHLGSVCWQALRVYLTGEAGIPFACSGPLHGERFGFASGGPVQDDCEMTNTRGREFALRINLKARLGRGETSIPVSCTETRIPRIFSCFAASKEGLKGQVKTHGHILQDLRVDRLQGGTFLFQQRIGGLLLVARQTPGLVLIRCFAFLKQMVIEPAALFECLVEPGFLLFGGIDAVLKHFTHVTTIDLSCSVVNGALPANPCPT